MSVSPKKHDVPSPRGEDAPASSSTSKPPSSTPGEDLSALHLAEQGGGRGADPSQPDPTNKFPTVSLRKRTCGVKCAMVLPMLILYTILLAYIVVFFLCYLMHHVEWLLGGKSNVKARMTPENPAGTYLDR